MSTTLSHTSTYVSEVAKTSAAKVATLFVNFTEFCYQASNAHRCSMEVERLMALSDDQLKILGLERGKIASHVFSKWMHI